ncbi:MAG TPA: DUF4382 domain-containing protein [Candidatus Polarisedimenticolia bacterium]|nr:DUF4382 domain-containing protein [Candidatus Polarisedimenticolia bacterium]
MDMRRARTQALVLVGALLLVVGCSTSGSPSVSGGTGHLEVHLTDSPIDLSNVTSVDVTITDVLVYGAAEGMNDDGSSPIVLSTHPETFNLLSLTGGATDLLASGEVPAGFYQRIRLVISKATLTYTDATTVDLKIESGKVDVPIGFQVSTGADMSMVLDFDAAASVQVNEASPDKFILRPVVTPKKL